MEPEHRTKTVARNVFLSKNCENRPIAKRAFKRWAVPGGCRDT